ncbi:MAG: carboxymuconolactone decarboxylase family protein [Nitrospinota bacterium]|jgi:alkylhydroperoxidase/carboxymuconolactone decarboxylase family protein YurZ|nr:carboxymuconolactone decarboxylase family protein [Nitrospinota bacterium]
MSPDSEKSLADQIAERRGKRYPAHAFIAEKFPDYMEALLRLDDVIREKERLFDEKMHELFHILALAVAGSNPHNQPHLKQHLKKGLELGLRPEEIGEALMVCVNPCGAKVLTYGVTCMLEAMSELGSGGWRPPE